MVDKLILPLGALTLLRLNGNTVSCACERTKYEWEDNDDYIAPFSGMDDDFKMIPETEALALLDKFKYKL